MKQTKRKRESAAPEIAVETPTAAAQTSPATARTYALQSSCTVRDSVALREDLLKLLDVSESVVLDVGAVERVDTAAMQVLCAFVRDRAAAGRMVTWRGTPESFVEAVGLLGMSKYLNVAVTAQTGASA